MNHAHMSDMERIKPPGYKHRSHNLSQSVIKQNDQSRRRDADADDERDREVYLPVLAVAGSQRFHSELPLQESISFIISFISYNVAFPILGTAYPHPLIKAERISSML
jgi:hypothetical protein